MANSDELPTYGQLPRPGISPTGHLYAEWIWRVAAYLVDILPVAVFAFLGDRIGAALADSVVDERSGINVVVSQSSGIGNLLEALCYVVAVGIYIANKGIREGRTGQSFGKQLCGLTTVRESTEMPLGPGRGVVRSLLLIVDFGLCYAGVLWPLWDHKRQCLISDKSTNTVVYRSARRRRRSNKESTLDA